MCAVNFNTICGYHIDRDDDQYGFCWLVLLGEWEGDDLIFSQLNVRIKLKSENILAFKSNLLVYENLPCFGIRHLLVFFTHNNLFLETFVHMKNNNNQKKRKSNIVNQKNKKKK